MGFLSWLKSKLSRRKAPPPVSFVWLLDEPKVLDQATVQRLVEQALGVSFPADEENPERFVVGEPPAIVVKLDSHMLLINQLPVPYLDNSQKAAESIDELRLRQAVMEHTAWVSADLLGEYEGELFEEGCRLIGKVAAALADHHCLALYVPHAESMVPFDAELPDKLRSDDPMSALGWSISPVINIGGDDPEMKAAVAEARRRWPEFVQAYQFRRPGQSSFSIKAPVTDGQNTEFIWIEVQSIDGDVILGDLANQPVDLKFMKEGDRVRVSLEDLNDWAYLDSEQMVGGFTSEVLQRAWMGSR